MAKKPSPVATPAPITPTVAPLDPDKVVEAAADPGKVYYYRIRKITGFLYEILEVEVDESKFPPKVVSKQDMKHLLVDKMTDLVCPHPDTQAKRKREFDRKKEQAAKTIAAVVAKVQE